MNLPLLIETLTFEIKRLSAVCLSARLWKNYWHHFHQTRWKGRALATFQGDSESRGEYTRFILYLWKGSWRNSMLSESPSSSPNVLWNDILKNHYSTLPLICNPFCSAPSWPLVCLITCTVTHLHTLTFCIKRWEWK